MPVNMQLLRILSRVLSIAVQGTERSSEGYYRDGNI